MGTLGSPRRVCVVTLAFVGRLRDKTKALHGQTRYTTFLPHPSHPLHHSPSTLSAVSHLSVTVCRLGLSGIICRYQEQIISETPVPYFGVFNFQIVLQDVSSMGQAPLQSMVAKIVVCSCDILGWSGCLSSSSSASCISCLLVPRGLQLIRFKQSSLKLG